MLPRRDTKKTRLALVLSAMIIFLGEILAGFLIDRAPLEIRNPDAARIMRVSHKDGTPPDIVFFGSSRFQSQIDADTIEQELARTTTSRPPFVLNAGISYGEPVVFDFLVTRLLDAGVRPSIAVIEVSPETVSRRNIALEVHVTRQFTWANALDSLPHMVYSGGFSRLLSARFIPVYLFRHEFRRWAIEGSGLQFLLCCPVDSTRPSPRAQAPAVAKTPRTEQLKEGASVTRSRLRYFKVGGLSARALERLLARYKSLGVTTILLGVPISSPSRAEYVPEIDGEFLAYMQKLREIYGLYFVDYRDRVPDEFFRSAYYTTAQGTLYVSRLLAREILAPLWQNRHTRTDAVSPQIDVRH